MIISNIKKNSLVLLLVLFAFNSYANSQSKVLLARVDQLLKAAQALTLKAEQADLDNLDTTKFQYLWLIEDIQMMRTGIEDYINNVRVAPSSIKRLQPVYPQSTNNLLGK
jgi:RAQPRD family integrative conjugative element protein